MDDHVKYLITGTGRCGTLYVSRLLTSMHIPCGHEAIFKTDGLDKAKLRLKGNLKPDPSYCSQNKRNPDGTWEPIETQQKSFVAESSYMAAPYLNVEELKETRVVHLVRNPSKVVRSFVGSLKYFVSHIPTNEFEKFIYDLLPELKVPMSVWDRSCLYWILWTEMIDRIRPDSCLIKVEQAPKAFVDWLGIEMPDVVYADTFANSFHQSSPAFDVHNVSQEVRKRFADRSLHYGYHISENLFV